jgi:hypothetical protein
MKQQHNAAVICFDRGEEIGRDTLQNWSKKLKIPDRSANQSGKHKMIGKFLCT